MDTIIDFIISSETEKNISLGSKQSYIDVLSKFSVYHKNKPFKRIIKEDVLSFLNSFRKPEELDPLHRWIGTYNLYKVQLEKFFKWLYNPDLKSEDRPKPKSIDNIPRLKRKEKSIYKPSDLWSVDDDILFLKYCPYPRERCYHAMSKDSSCRPHELLKLKIKDIVFKEISGKKYAEIVVSGKTGQRHMPLINSIPYLKDWLDNHPMKNIPTSPLICSTGKVLGQKIRSAAVREMYLRMREYFTQLLEDPRVLPEDKPKIHELLSKPWNPYVFRHSALTDKSKMLKESHLRQHAGWSISSNMPQVYLHYFGNESSSSILEAYGLKPHALDVDKLKPKECPNCQTPNKIDTKFCVKCGFGMTMDAWQEAKNAKEEKESIKAELVKEMDKMFDMRVELWRSQLSEKYTLFEKAQILGEAPSYRDLGEIPKALRKFYGRGGGRGEVPQELIPQWDEWMKKVREKKMEIEEYVASHDREIFGQVAHETEALTDEFNLRKSKR